MKLENEQKNWNETRKRAFTRLNLNKIKPPVCIWSIFTKSWGIFSELLLSAYLKVDKRLRNMTVFSKGLPEQATNKLFIDSLKCPPPRKSLVKGERFMRSEEKPELSERDLFLLSIKNLNQNDFLDFVIASIRIKNRSNV